MSRSKSVAYFSKQTLEGRVTLALSKKKGRRRGKKLVAKVRKKERAALRPLLEFANETARSWRRVFGLPGANCVLRPAEVLNKAAWDHALQMHERCRPHRK